MRCRPVYKETDRVEKRSSLVEKHDGWAYTGFNWVLRVGLCGTFEGIHNIEGPYYQKLQS